MLLVIGVSFFPLFGFAIFGLFLTIFPGAALNIQHFSGSMKGNLFDNNLDFRESSLIITRITGMVFIGIGIGIFMLINGWLDFLVLNS